MEIQSKGRENIRFFIHAGMRSHVFIWDNEQSLGQEAVKAEHPKCYHRND